MALEAFGPRVIYIGANNLDEYDFDFKIAAETQLLVIVLDDTGAEIERVRGDDTTYLDHIEFDADEGGGTVFLQANLPTGYRIGLFQANDAPTQPSEFKGKRSFSMPNIESALDFSGEAIQRVSWLVQRCLRQHDMSEAAFDLQLPYEIEGDRVLMTGPGGTSLIEGPTQDEIADAVGSAAAAAASEAAAAASAAAAAASAAAALVSENNAETAETNAEGAQAAAEAARDEAIAVVASAGFIQSGPFTVLVNTNQDLAGETTDNTQYKRVDYEANIERGTTIFNTYSFSKVYRNGAWRFIDRGESWEDTGVWGGVTFTVDAVTGAVNAAVANDGGSNAEIELKKLYWPT